MVVPDYRQPDLWDHPLGGGTLIRETKLFTDNPRGAFSNRACLPGMGWPRRCKSGPVRICPPFRRCTPSSYLSVMARSAGASRRIPSSAVKIKPSRRNRAGGASSSPILSKQSDCGYRYDTYRIGEYYFHGRKFSGAPGKCLRPGTSLQAHSVLRDDRVRCLESFLAEAKDSG